MIPESMKKELGAWNNGNGIDLEGWISCEGNFRLAVGYMEILWPHLVEFDGYILRDGFQETSLRGFEKQCKGDRRAVEAVMNQLHIEDLHYQGCEDFSSDKAILLGNTLKEMYEAKLVWQFPNYPCRVSFFEPEDKANLSDYELTFWQVKHE